VATAARVRFPTIDYIKAAAIVAVTMTHAVPDLFDPGTSRFDRVAASLTCFHVPAFLLAAGLLATRAGPVGWHGVRDRLQRVLVPYLIATVVALLTGLWTPTTPRMFVFRVVTGSGLGIYYFVPVLACCIVLLPLLSRLRTAVLAMLTATLGIYAEIAWHQPAWRLTHEFFWQIRDVFLQFHLGHFLLGVLAARGMPALRGFQARWPGLILTVSAVGVAWFVWLAATESPWAWQPLVHTAYLLGLVGVIASLAPAGPALAPVRFLSEATLTIYLYHLMVYPLVMPQARLLLDPPLRFVLMSALGLAFGTLVVVAGRRGLGRRSRLLLGA
jgi:peptidoglycan/LPS O-acetylase OafA/YrhL